MFDSCIIEMSLSEASDSVLLSLIQKLIRRCKKNEALDVLGEIIRRINLAKDAQRLLRLLRRLAVICSEDIGISQLKTIVWIQKINEKIIDCFNNGLEDKSFQFLMTAVATLAESKKSRMTDSGFIWASLVPTADPVPHTRDEIFTYLLNQNTDEIEETQLMRICLAVHRRVSAAATPHAIFEALAIRFANNVDLTIELNGLQKAFQNDQCPLYLVHACLLVTRGNEISQVVKVVPVSLKETNQFIAGPRLLHNIPDYAFDQHTTEGRRLQRGLVHFLTVSTVLNNCSIPDWFHQQLVLQNQIKN